MRISWSDRVISIIILLMALFLSLLCLSSNGNRAPEWLNVLVYMSIPFEVAGLIYVRTLKLYEKETPEGRQELEDWLASQGYRRFNGKVKITKETITFTLGDKTDRFLNDVPFEEHNGYKYWDNGDYRTVKLANSEMANVYFVK